MLEDGRKNGILRSLRIYPWPKEYDRDMEMNYQLGLFKLIKAKDSQYWNC